ncbi:MAG: hypothetical protein OXI40_08635 [Chloroflexota bacterium]|nr:hypothetical protein [Chloroflexota bacterium]
MRHLRAVTGRHLHFIVVVTLLAIWYTFPTIVHVFKTDSFWLPSGGSFDIYLHIWDKWYWQQIFSGQADRMYTTALFYPQGLSLAHHPLSSLPTNIVQLVLQTILPVSNVFCFAYLLVIFLNAVSAYVYMLWLFKQKWIALIGAVVFGFSPHLITKPNQLHDATVAPIALAFYCFHRGIVEKRSRFIIFAGLLTGLTSTITLYNFSCLLISLAAGVCAFAIGRWRDGSYWASIALLALTIAASSIWAIGPMLSDSQLFDAALGWHEQEVSNDLIYSLVNHRHPILGPLADSALQIPPDLIRKEVSYLGYLPLLLIGIGLFRRDSGRKMIPWLALGLGFMILKLGSTLSINGVEYPQILLPKYYLNEIFPFVFKAFTATSRFHAGVLLPFTVLSCYGLYALIRARPAAPWSRIILLLIGLLAFEYYSPIYATATPYEQFEYLKWLDQEDDSDRIHLINLPMGRTNSKLYSLYQSLSGYPHAEGAISRTPDSAYDYIRANFVLKTWHKARPINCFSTDRGDYKSAIRQLQKDSFSHIVHHRGLKRWETVLESFQYVEPAYTDDFVSVYRLTDLLDSCSR